MPEWEAWCRVRWVGPGGLAQDGGAFGGIGPPDLRAVDRLGRLLVSRAGWGERPVLTDVCPRLAELLELVGLGELVVEMQREPEGGEEPFGVQEREKEAHLGDGPP